MILYAIKRLLTCIFMLFLASIVVFIALEILPGNVAQILSGPDADPQTVAALAQELGLNKPALQRYVTWIAGLPQGDLGISYVYGTPVADLIDERLQVTLPLAFMAMLLTLFIALPVGVYAAAHHGQKKDHALMLFSELGLAIPNFWLAIILILIFSITLQWAPFGGFPGWHAYTGGGLWAGIKALLLPAIALALVQVAILCRFTRSALLEVMYEQFVMTVRAKGASKSYTLWRHVLKNAWIPILTLAGLQFANLIAGAVVTENVFILPGLGRLIFNAIANRDLIVIRNVLLLLIGMVMVINMLVDLMCAAIDPRWKNKVNS